tara:strand:- start:202 stop:387 length:186 start_codon:yes stop_codon:yes gene_type:complete
LALVVIGGAVIFSDLYPWLQRGCMAKEFVVTGDFLKKRRIRQYDRLKKIFCGGKGLRQAPR